MPEEQKDEEISLSELEEAKKQAEDNLNGWKREKADFINFQKEVAKQKDDWIKFSNRDLLLKILPILDGFDEAMKYASKEKDEFVKGVEQIKKQFDEFLKNSGVEKMSTDEGEKFNPEIHEPISAEKVEGIEPDMILREVQAGYKLNDKILRPPKVVVSK
jgi:molecular chaperone GrpE